MQNLENSARSKGVLIFAFNTAETDYVSIADCAAALAHKNLGLPVTLCTDIDAEPKFAYDKILRLERGTDAGNFRINGYNEVIEWRNFGRYLAYDISPYDQTLLIDGDYFILENNLLLLFEVDTEYQLMRNNYSPGGYVDASMGPMSLPYVWATVILFDKSLKSQALFELTGKIQRNYKYFCSLFNVSASNYRNDHAFAMAHYIIANDNKHFIPYSMYTIDCAIESLELTNKIIFKTTDTAYVLPIQNLHIMNKEFLTSKQFKTFHRAAMDV